MVPTFLPAVFLPFFGAATQLKTPPKNLRALFDFALAGPAAGIIVSLGLLLGGLQLTQSLDSTSLTYFPNLKVDFLRASSLGGGIVDGVLGGDIFALGDESTTALSLHPFTIAGFVGLMVNALALLPIGSE